MERIMDKSKQLCDGSKTISELLSGKKMRSMVIRVSSEDYCSVQHISRQRKIGVFQSRERGRKKR